MQVTLKGFMQHVSDKTQNGFTYWGCEDYFKCKSSTHIEDNSLNENVVWTVIL